MARSQSLEKDLHFSIDTRTLADGVYSLQSPTAVAAAAEVEEDVARAQSLQRYPPVQHANTLVERMESFLLVLHSPTAVAAAAEAEENMACAHSSSAFIAQRQPPPPFCNICMQSPTAVAAAAEVEKDTACARGCFHILVVQTFVIGLSFYFSEPHGGRRGGGGGGGHGSSAVAGEHARGRRHAGHQVNLVWNTPCIAFAVRRPMRAGRTA